MDTGDGPNAQTMPMKEGAQSMFALLQNLNSLFLTRQSHTHHHPQPLCPHQKWDQTRIYNLISRVASLAVSANVNGWF